MEYLKKTYKKEIFPLFIIICSLVISAYLALSSFAGATLELKALGKTVFFKKADILYFNYFIIFLYLVFLAVDRQYYYWAKRKDFYYFNDIYVASNLLLLLAVIVQFSVAEYLLGRTESPATYFMSLGALAVIGIIVIIFRIILKSGSIRYYGYNEERK